MNKEYSQSRSALSTHVTPAILPIDAGDLISKMSRVADLVDWVQIDAVDGVYAPHKTWPYINDEDELFAKIVRQDEPMPFSEEVNFEVDLMVKDPMFEADRWIAAGAMRLVVHMDSIEKEKFVELARTIREKGVELVLGFGIESSHEKLAEYMEAVEKEAEGHHPVGHIIRCIQCMGIRKIGFQSQPFDEAVLENIKKIKRDHSGVLISVDGGVSLETAPSLIKVGANRLVVGSALYGAESMEDTAVELSSLFSK